MTAEYYLMKKDDVVAKVLFQNHIPHKYLEIYDKNKVPVGTTSSFKQTEEILLRK